MKNLIYLIVFLFIYVMSVYAETVDILIMKAHNESDHKVKINYLNEAIRYLSEVLILKPNQSEILLKRACVEIMIGEEKAALDDLNKSIKYDDQQKPKKLLELLNHWAPKLKDLDSII
jgi:hypothetical protein